MEEYAIVSPLPAGTSKELVECRIDIDTGTEKIQAGKEFLKQLYSGIEFLHDRDQMHKNAELAVWALYGMTAKNKNQYFTEGTFSVYDDQDKLFNFLKPIAYKRISSHHKGYSTQHYGIDFKEGELPCRKKHLLFAQLANHQLFLKPENHGTQNVTDTILHGQEWLVAQARKIETLRSLFDLASDQDPEFKKERISGNLLKKFKGLITELETDQETQKLHLRSAQFYGTQKIVSILKEYLTSYKPLEQALVERPASLSESYEYISQADIDKARDKINQIVNFLEELATQDNLFERTGNEIVFSQNDMKKLLSPQRPAATPQMQYRAIPPISIMTIMPGYQRVSLPKQQQVVPPKSEELD
jgi:hypothetical protein